MPTRSPARSRNLPSSRNHLARDCSHPTPDGCQPTAHPPLPLGQLECVSAPCTVTRTTGHRAVQNEQLAGPRQLLKPGPGKMRRALTSGPSSLTRWCCGEATERLAVPGPESAALHAHASGWARLTHVHPTLLLPVSRSSSRQ